MLETKHRRLLNTVYIRTYHTDLRCFFTEVILCNIDISRSNITQHYIKHDSDKGRMLLSLYINPRRIPHSSPSHGRAMGPHFRVICTNNHQNRDISRISWFMVIHVHYADVIMTTMASQITSLTVVYSTVYSDADQRKHQSSASLAFVWGIHRDRWIPRTKGQLRGKCFHLMTSSCN